MIDSLFIPRSTIAAYAQSEDVLSVLKDLKAHPLLTRAQYDATAGGIQTIINTFPSGGTPDLLILEHDGPMNELDRLADISAASTQLIVLSRDNDVGRYRSLLDKGGADYLFTPVRPELLLAAISRTFARAENRKTGTLLTVFSCGRGSGGSTIAQNAAVLLSQQPEKKAMLLDFDLHTGTVALTFDLNPIRGLRDLLRDPKSITAAEIGKLTQERSMGLQILCSTPMLEPGFPLKADSFVDLLDQARTLVDYLIVDLPGGWSGLHSKLLAMSEQAILVATTDLGSFQTLHNVEDLATKLRQNLPPAHVVLNRWSPAGEKLLSSKLFADLAKGGRLVRVGDFGQASLAAAEAGKAVAELTPRPPVLDDLAEFLADLVGARRKQAKAGAPAPLWARLLKKRSSE